MVTKAALNRERHDFIASYGDGVAYSLAVGFGETYFSAFALAMGISQLTAGLLTSVPLIAGGVLQLFAPVMAVRFGSYRRWIVAAAIIQALIYIPLAWAASVGSISTLTLFLLTAIYWSSALAQGPIWNHWIGIIIPNSRLRDFLAVRSRLTQLAAFLAFLLGGLGLQSLTGKNLERLGFVLLFVFAFIFRLISIGFLASQTDAPAPPHQKELSLKDAFKRFMEPESGRFLTFLLASQVSVAIGGSFFSPFMLGHLRFSYADYVAIVSAAFVAKIAFYPWVARFVKRVGAFRSLIAAGFIIAPPPLFWFLMPSLGALIILQLFAGVAWAVFELSSMLLVFDRLAPQERIRMLTIFNFLNALATVIGALIGGSFLGATPSAHHYMIIFSISAVCRLASLGALIGSKDVAVRFRRLAFRTTGLRPFGFLSSPIFFDSRRRLSKQAKKQSKLANKIEAQ